MTSAPSTRTERGSGGPSPKVVRIVAGVVGVLFIIAGIIRVFVIDSSPQITPQEAQDALTDMAQKQRLEEEVRQYVMDDDPFLDPTESILVTCSQISAKTYSCYVDRPSGMAGGDILTIKVSPDGSWRPTSE